MTNQELLLKVRKNATASLGAGHWKIVLETLGFRFEPTKVVNRKTLAVRITAPNGATLEVVKDLSYKHIVFYGIHIPSDTHHPIPDDPDYCVCGRSPYGPRMWPCISSPTTTLERWAAAQGSSLADLAARALGMPTMDEERAAKDYHARDWTHTGTCGVCDQNVKMGTAERQALVLHGYRRPGDGSTHGECFGRGYLPHELVPDAARDFLAIVLIPTLKNREGYLTRLKTGKVTKLELVAPDHQRGRKGVYVEAGDPTWAAHLANAIDQQTWVVGSAQKDVDTFTKKVAEWKVEELPEVKMAKLFGTKSA